MEDTLWWVAALDCRRDGVDFKLVMMPMASTSGEGTSCTKGFRAFREVRAVGDHGGECLDEHEN
jgi:hypothetical protein